MAQKKVFITGATGYVGGQVLHDLLQIEDYEFEVRALVRSDAKAEALEKAVGQAGKHEVKAVIGDLDSSDLIEHQVNDSDIIINTADVDHVPSAKVIVQALNKKNSKTIFLHTSGSSIVGDDTYPGKGPSSKIYSDVKNIDEINNLPINQPHRPVDKLVLDNSDKNPNVDYAIVCPSNIFGISDGYNKVNSIQIPLLATYFVKTGQPFTVFEGDYIWNHIHIKDLGALYLLILQKLLEGESIPKGKKGYYFGSYALPSEDPATTSVTEIEHTWKEVSIAVAESLYKKKLIDSKDVKQLSPEEIIAFADGFDFAPYLWSTNSRSRADNGYAIGWKPKYVHPDNFWDTIDIDIAHLQKIGAIPK